MVIETVNPIKNSTSLKNNTVSYISWDSNYILYILSTALSSAFTSLNFSKILSLPMLSVFMLVILFISLFPLAIYFIFIKNKVNVN